MVFTGTFQRTLDGKLRVLLPKRMRTELSESPRLFLTPGPDHCLEMHSDVSLNELAVKANKSSSGSRNLRSFSRLFYARAQQCDMDKQGRIRIPSQLAGIADLGKDIVIVGVGFHWEIWDQARWEGYLAQHHQAFDEIAETTFNPPGFSNFEESTEDQRDFADGIIPQRPRQTK
ncbi:MAG: division/cell wall cluster transcriptional repressor MraZ [Mariniblastus sp.]|nr:division/cell wall cluster transcriptional repressor MraZ [Mariniblastus sp.]